MFEASRKQLTSGKSILEDLFETQELQDGEVDTGVQTETTLVGAKSGVELHAVSTVDLELALVVFPGDTELDDALGDGGDLESALVIGVLLEESRGLERGRKLPTLKRQMSLRQLLMVR